MYRVTTFKNIQFLYGKFIVAPFVVNNRSDEGSIIHLVVRINTLIHSLRTVFLLFKQKYCFHQGDKGAEGKALDRDDYHISNTFLQRTEEPSYLSHV